MVWLVVTSFTLAICTFTCMFAFVLLCFSVIHFNRFEFNLPSLCKVDTPRSRYCRSSLLTLQGVVLLAMACPVSCQDLLIKLDLQWNYMVGCNSCWGHLLFLGNISLYSEYRHTISPDHMIQVINSQCLFQKTITTIL